MLSEFFHWGARGECEQPLGSPREHFGARQGRRGIRGTQAMGIAVMPASEPDGRIGASAVLLFAAAAQERLRMQP